MRRIRSVLVAGIVAAFAFPGVAAARPGDQTFDQTYPQAAALCAAVAAGTTPAPYVGNEFNVSNACLALHAAFDAADTAMDAANATFDGGVAAAGVVRDAACTRPRRPIACLIARANFRVAVWRLRGDQLAAVLAYRDALRATRVAFWDAANAPPEPQPT